MFPVLQAEMLRGTRVAVLDMYEIRIPKCARQEPGTTQSRACKDARLQFQTWHRITAVHWRDATCTAAVEVVILRLGF